MTRVSWYDAMTVTVPEGELDGIAVERFEVPKKSLEGLRQALIGRPVAPGTYTRLVEGHRRWLSATPAEKRDHAAAVIRIAEPHVRRVVINGLGLGMVLQAALSFDHVEHVDVVELDERVIKLIGPHYTKDPRVAIIHADAYDQMSRWPRGTRWDVGWSDIWPDMCADDLADMARLRRSYGRRCSWHDCWGRQEILAHRGTYGW